jgi:hypothetical protein
MNDRFFQPQQHPRRRLAWRRGKRLGLAAEHAVERVDRIISLPEPPRQRPARDASERADGLEAEPFEGAGGVNGQAESGDGKGSEKGA